MREYPSFFWDVKNAQSLGSKRQEEVGKDNRLGWETVIRAANIILGKKHCN